jgi:acyl-CoA synthetase (NDP forming)
MLVLQTRVWAVFGSLTDESDLRPGRVSGAFQSGGFGFGIVNLAEQQGVGFRICVSSGNETDVTMPELLGTLVEDEGTDMAFGLLEGTPDARRLLEVGRRSLELGKPVAIWKSATTAEGARAAASHTANLTGSTELWRAALRQAGLIEVDDVEPITDLARLVAQGRLPKGPRVGVLSISGGSSIVFADRATPGGLALPPFSAATRAALCQIIPVFGSPENPADVTASVFNDMSMLTRAVEIVQADPGIDQVVLMLASLPGAPALRAAEAIAAAAGRTDKPVTLVWSGRRSKSEPAYQVLEAARVPIIPTPSRMAAAMARLTWFAMRREAMLARPSSPSPLAGEGQGGGGNRRCAGTVAETLIADRARGSPPSPTLPRKGGGSPTAVVPAGRITLSEVDSKRLLSEHGIEVTREVQVVAGADAAAASVGLSPPFAVKIVSADIAHKSDIGGVRLGVGREGLAAAVREVLASARKAVPEAHVDGVLVAEMAHGVELLIGVVDDPSFGPAVAVGLGGIMTEVMHDVSHRIAPFDLDTAREMIGELKGVALLRGHRGGPPADIEALAHMLVRVSDLAMAMRGDLAELDINPVFVRPVGQGVVAADALAVLRNDPGPERDA